MINISVLWMSDHSSSYFKESRRREDVFGSSSHQTQEVRHRADVRFLPPVRTQLAEANDLLMLINNINNTSGRISANVWSDGSERPYADTQREQREFHQCCSFLFFCHKRINIKTPFSQNNTTWSYLYNNII